MVQASNDPNKKPRRLVAGRDYPRTYRKFVEMFPDDEACVRYLERLRWPEGFSCPACGVRGEPWRASRGRRLCRGCRRASPRGSGLEEFTFRFNRRTSRNRGLVFRRLIEQAVATGPITEADVTNGYQWE